MKAHFESLWTNSKESFSVSVQHKKTFDVPFHYHPEYELTFILASKGVRYVGNHFQSFEEHDFVLLGPNLPHCWKNAQRTTAASAVVIHWKHDFMSEGWIDRPEFQHIKKLLESSTKGIEFDKATAKKIKAQLMELATLKPFEKLLFFLNLLQELAVTAKYKFIGTEEEPFALNPVIHERLDKVYQYVQKHFKQKISLHDISRQVNMTDETFSRFFSKRMRKTFFSFLNEYRIDQACRLLIQSNKSIVEICYESGYESLPFFYRQFKKIKQCSPLQYRLNFKNAIIT